MLKILYHKTILLSIYKNKAVEQQEVDASPLPNAQNDPDDTALSNNNVAYDNLVVNKINEVDAGVVPSNLTKRGSHTSSTSEDTVSQNNPSVKGYSIRDDNAALEPSSSEGAKRLNASGIVKNIDNSDGFMSCLHNKRAIPVRHGSCFLTPNRFIIAY